jgi:hypothetical protein
VISILFKGETRAVSDIKFTEINAAIICKELYKDERVLDFYTGVKADYQSFWLSDVSCIGTEDKLGECNHAEWGVANANWQSNGIAVFCVAGGPKPVEAKVIQADNGDILIKHKNEIKSLCGNAFTK